MNAALKAYLKELHSACDQNSGNGYAVQKCISAVSKARSEINPAKVEVFKFFGDYVCQRVNGHFSKPEHRDDLLKVPVSDVGVQVRAALDNALIQGVLSGKSMGRKLRGEVERTRDALDGFMSLENACEVSMLKSCTPELADLLKELFPPARKRRAPTAPNIAPSVRPKRHKKNVAENLAVPAVQPATASQPMHRPCKPYSGGWAIMVALHTRSGGPCTKDMDSVVRWFGTVRVRTVPLHAVLVMIIISLIIIIRLIYYNYN